MLLYSWLGIILLSYANKMLRQVHIFLEYMDKSIHARKLTGGLSIPKWFRLFHHHLTLLTMGMVAAFFLGVIPYRPDLNPNGNPVGVDFHYYVEWVTPMLQRPFGDALSYAMGPADSGSRPLILIPIYLAALSRLVSIVQVVEALAAILGPLLVLSIFIFAREFFQSSKLAGIAALVTAFSFNITVGIWAGYYANMLALAIGYLFLTVLVRYYRQRSHARLVLLCIGSLALLLSHPLTWLIILVTVSVFAFATWMQNHDFTLTRLVILLVALDLFIDVIRTLIFGGEVSSQATLGVFVPGRAVNEIPNLWTQIVNGLFIPYDGLLTNTLILSLSLIGIASLALRHNVPKRLLIIWIAISSIPIFVLAPLLLTRVLYDLPISILTMIGLVAIMAHASPGRLLSHLVFLLVMLALANYAFRAVTNLVAMPF